ncbi:MAG: HNH endonuclease [Phycisphaeraceae bacterium]|nr:HNH endonuclease [Phycisphaerales bacterium]MCB9843685.1 HNH endonuclease [Phycisphaeraceae bacterium]
MPPNRKKFIESVGATCPNWTWSWSFVNESDRFVVFGAWDFLTDEGTTLILNREWEYGRNGKRKPAYRHSVEHLRLVEEEGFRLFVFPQMGRELETRAEIIGFEPSLFPKVLVRQKERWYACDDAVTVVLPVRSDDSANFTEGKVRVVLSNTYERNPIARRECIRIQGWSCAVCEFNFEHAYGDLGEKYIHVHHLIPIASIGQEYQIDPAKDLVPICPNCHAMIHRRDPPLAVEELRRIIRSNK